MHVETHRSHLTRQAPPILQGSNRTETSRYIGRSRVESWPQKHNSREQAQTERLSALEQTHSREISASSYVTAPSVLQARGKTETRNSRRSRPESPARRSIIDEALAEIEARNARSVQEQVPTARTRQDTSASPGKSNQPTPRGIGRYESPQDSRPQQQTRDPEEIELMSLPRREAGSNPHVSGGPGLTTASSPDSPIRPEAPTSSPIQTAQQVLIYKPRTDSLTARRPRSRVVSQSSSQPQSQAHGPAGQIPQSRGVMKGEVQRHLSHRQGVGYRAQSSPKLMRKQNTPRQLR